MSSFRLENVTFADPNARVRVGLAFADYTGGQSFQSQYRNAGFAALAPGGVGAVITPKGAGASTHTASEIEFDYCTFAGEAWGVRVGGGQTGNLTFRRATFAAVGNSANSGGLANFGTFDAIKIYGETLQSGEIVDCGAPGSGAKIVAITSTTLIDWSSFSLARQGRSFAANVRPCEISSPTATPNSTRRSQTPRPADRTWSPWMHQRK